VAAASGPFGGTTNVSATLTSGGAGVSGATVSFSVNGTSVGSATTDGTGVATLSNVSLAGITAGTYSTGVGASFAGEAAHAAVTGTASLTVTAAATTTAVFEPFDNGPAGAVVSGALSVGAVSFSPDHVPDTHGGTHSGVFDGKPGTYVVEPATPALDLSTATLDFWFQPAQTIDGVVGTVPQGLAGYTSSPNPGVVGFGNWDKDIYIDATGHVNFYAWLPGASVVSSRASTWCAGTWYHLTASIGPSGGQQLFVNGQLEASNVNAKTSFNGSHYQLVIGASPSTSPVLQYFHGKIDEVRVETRELAPAPAPAGLPTTASCTPTPPPAAPTGLTATAGNAQVGLNWTAVSGATSYTVKRSTVSGGSYTTVGSSTGTSCIDTGLTNGATYFYVVTAVSSTGESPNSTQVSATPQAPAAAPAVSLSPTSPTFGSQKVGTTSTPNP
jgi:hypothetical protein